MNMTERAFSSEKASNTSRFAYLKQCIIQEYPLSNIAMIFFFVQMFANIYLIVKYSQPEFYDHSLDAFLIQNWAFLFFSTSGLLLHQWAYGIHTVKEGSSYSYGMALLYALIGLVAVAYFQIIIIGLTKISISKVDLYIFFGSTAIAEEFLFRYGLQLAMGKWLKKVFNSASYCETYSEVLAIFITSFMFGLYHYFVKGSWALLLAVFVSGLILGVILRLSKSIDSTIIAHFAVNILTTIFS
jgi:membrane protease YdiL (CAAX protease family)